MRNQLGHFAKNITINSLKVGKAMSHTQCSVTIKQLPERISINHSRNFLRELTKDADEERPCIVFDCSRIVQMDIPAVKLFLDCLEIAMKRNGDIKLAAMHAQPKAMLELIGVDRLFEIFDTTADAAKSFRRLSSPPTLHIPVPNSTLHQSAENAA
jgi:anti-anti-sigma regulatory factor